MSITIIACRKWLSIVEIHLRFNGDTYQRMDEVRFISVKFEDMIGRGLDPDPVD